MTERSVYWSWNKCPENSHFQLQEVAWANTWKHYLMSYFNENITEVSASYSLWDAISSKTLENKKTGLVRARRALIGFGHQRQDTNEKKKGSTYKALKWSNGHHLEIRKYKYKISYKYKYKIWRHKWEEKMRGVAVLLSLFVWPCYLGELKRSYIAYMLELLKPDKTSKYSISVRLPRQWLSGSLLSGWT